jgi:hypothetical protein
MKKLVNIIAAFTTVLSAVSCQQELLDASRSDAKVTFKVDVPEIARTKAVGEMELEHASAEYLTTLRKKLVEYYINLG